MKKINLFLAFVMIAALVLTACGGSKTPTEADCAKADVLCVGLVTDVGEVDDKSFNQSAYEGVKQAGTELGALVNYVETKDAKDYGTNIALFAEKKYDVIVTVGYALGDATIQAATTYPDIKFIGVDQFQVPGSELPNLAGLIFSEDKAGFLAGALAAMLTETGTVAAVLGTDLVPPVVAFKEGYEAGAIYINPNLDQILADHLGQAGAAFERQAGAARGKVFQHDAAEVVLLD